DVPFDLLIVIHWSSLYFCFFFSSRRRHTRSYGDWSSDVCSSDLEAWSQASWFHSFSFSSVSASFARSSGTLGSFQNFSFAAASRSEERRVGKECRSRWWQ